jgi:hypothetical protein
MALVILGALCETHDRRAMLRCLAVSFLLIPLSIAWLLPDMPTYRGLSGIDSALFVLLSGTILRESLIERRWAWAIAAVAVLCAFVAKTGFELASGQTLFVDSPASSMVPIPLAHIIGGLAAGLSCMMSSQRKSHIQGDIDDEPTATRRRGVSCLSGPHA